MEIDWNVIDKIRQKKWSENNDHETDSNNKEKKFITVAYPYPNSPQHIGHGRTYTIADVHSRYLRMKGFNVLFPMGFHYTGTPILGMAKRVEANDAELIEGFKTLYNVPEDKIKELKNIKEKQNIKFDIEVDGGIDFDNSKLVVEAGANILVSGTTIFKNNDGDIKKNIETLKSI